MSEPTTFEPTIEPTMTYNSARGVRGNAAPGVIWTLSQITAVVQSISKRVLARVIAPCALVCLGFVSTAHAQTIAVAGQGIASPVYVNIYWDVNWDADSPGMTRETVDSFVNALLSSSYFAGLGEYGVGAPALGGSFLPDPNCTQTAPARVGFYDPVNPSIIGFVQCEVQHASSLPQGANIIYNIILPPQSLESDLGGAMTFCTGTNPVSWHYHGAPLFWQGTPIYTIVSAASACGSFTNNLVHEMIEAASDPFPPFSVVTTGTGEIADLCTSAPTTSPFAVPETAGFIPTISVPAFWSNAGQKCVIGFSDTTRPAISSPISVTGDGLTMAFAITGSGFGLLPPSIGSPISGDLPYLAIRNQTEGWEAGDALNSDSLGLNVNAWGSQITINGFSVTSGFLIKPNDALTISACNPASGLCASAAATTPPGSYAPRLIVSKGIDPPTDKGRFNLLIDGKTVASNVGATTTAPQNVSVGSHAVSETAAGSTNLNNYTHSFGGSCNTFGQVSLNEGEVKSCSIFNVNRSVGGGGGGGGCSAGMKCCRVGGGRCYECVGASQPCP